MLAWKFDVIWFVHLFWISRVYTATGICRPKLEGQSGRLEGQRGRLEGQRGRLEGERGRLEEREHNIRGSKLRDREPEQEGGGGVI